MESRYNAIKGWMQRLSGNRIKDITNVIIRGNGVYTEKTGEIMSAFLLVHGSLELQERRALHEEYREGTDNDIGHGVAGIGTGALIGERSGGSSKISDHIIEL